MSTYKRGYYLVKNGARHWVSEKVNPAALEKVAGKVLSDKLGYGYWIDYCHGLSVSGAPAWNNVDHTDLFI